jgi:ATP-dependent protease HslVU (ClpYQ) peptidase subunit
MTTIAWDGKTLAADSMGDQNGLRTKVRKLHRGVLADGKGFMFGGAGETAWCVMLYEWLKTLESKQLTRVPYPHQEERHDPACLLVVKRVGVFRKVGAVLIPVESNTHAIGSGRDFAISAMHFGHSAKDAVKHAMMFDVYSGGSIQTMDMEQS